MTGVRVNGVRRVAFAALLVIAVAACERHQADSAFRVHAGAEAPAHTWPLAQTTEHDVRVALRAEVDAAGAWIAATYTPERSGFHLYAKELPRDGLAGIGRPTLLELGKLDSDAPLVSRGPVQADRDSVALYVPVLKMTFPVYPEGPVTLRLPVAATTAADRRATLSVTYLACSESTCLAPVVGKQVVVTLPDDYVTRARAS